MAEKSLFQPTRPEEEIDVIAATFGGKPTLDELPAFKDFIDYYKAELQRVNYAVSLHNAEKHSFVVRDHAELASVIRTVHTATDQWMFDRITLRREIAKELRKPLSSRKFPPEDLNRCIDLVLRILALTNVREQCFALQTPETPLLEWNDHTPLRLFIDNLFREDGNLHSDQDRWLQSTFTVANMDSICGLSVKWTSSLEDHLRLDRGVKVLRVFPYKNILLRRLEYDQKFQNSCIFPPSLIEETLKTFDLLFPFGDSKTSSYLKRHMQLQIHGEGPFSNRRPLDLTEFNYWRERLLELHREVFQTPPQSWFQLLVDRRNPQQWLTLWIAFVVFLLTVVSTAAGIVQAWAAVKALKN